MFIFASKFASWLLAFLLSTDFFNYRWATAESSQYSYPICKRQLMHGLREASYLTHNMDNYNKEAVGLDAVLIKDQGKEQLEGNSGNAEMLRERQIYNFIASNKCISTICEIGFNGGHSTLNWLVANPNATVLIFDLWAHGYSAVADKYLREQSQLHPARFQTIVKGPSGTTVRQFHYDNPTVTCDLISVDGGHDFANAVADIENMQFFANPKFNILLIDDTNCDAHYCVDEAVREHLRRGTVKALDGWAIGAGRGVSVLTYSRHSLEFNSHERVGLEKL